MDRTQNCCKIAFSQWESSINAGSFLLVGATLSGTRFFTWFQGSISKEGILVTSLLNGSAILLGDKISKKAECADSYYKTTLTLIFFAASIFATPHVTATFFPRAVTKISLYAVCQISVVNLCLKAATFACYKFCHLTPTPSPENPQEIQKLPLSELNEFRELFKNQIKWNGLDLSSQISWNKVWMENKIAPILFTKLNTRAELESAELLLIETVHATDPSKEFSEFLYKHKRPPLEKVSQFLLKQAKTVAEAFQKSQQGVYRYDNLPLLKLPLSIDEISSMSIGELGWYHKLFQLDASYLEEETIQLFAKFDLPECAGKATTNLSPEENKAFSNRFFQLEIPPPSEHFCADVDPDIIKKDSNLSSAQISWCELFFFKNRDKWTLLSFKEQIRFTQMFGKQNLYRIPICYSNDADLDELDDNELKFAHEYYYTNPDEWKKLTKPRRDRLNATFTYKGFAKVLL